MHAIFATIAMFAAAGAAPTTTTTKTKPHTTSSSAGAPSADEALKVSNYYFDGKDSGPLLVKFIACLKVDEVETSKTKNECTTPVTGAVAKGSDVFGWTQWVVPVGASYDDVSLQFLLDGAVRETKDIPLTESLRLRTWRPATASKAGKWTIKLMRGGKEVSSVDFEVK